MQKITVICVGKLKERFYADACAEYRKRLSGLCALEMIELPEQRLGNEAGKAARAQALEREAEAIRPRLPRNSAVIALCVEGVCMSSEQFSRVLRDYGARGFSHVTFLIGSSIGLAENLKESSVLRLSFSPMTFPHHLARVLLLEQIYRAYQIEHNTKYHK